MVIPCRGDGKARGAQVENEAGDRELRAMVGETWGDGQGGDIGVLVKDKLGTLGLNPLWAL